MAVRWVEKGRFLMIETPLGAGKLMLRSFTGHEGISQLFCFELDLLSEDPAINFDGIVGQNVNFGVRLADESKARYFNGYVSRFVQLPSEERLTHYRAEVVPWLWFLTHSADCRIFQNMSVPDIVKQVFRDLGFTDFEDQTQGSYTPWEYCVQYRETAFRFVSRLLEQEGILYFFKHENGKHTLVLADSPTAHKPCPDQARVMFERTTGEGVKRDEDVVYLWRLEQEFRSGKYSLNDYNFETPATRLDSAINSQINQGGNSGFEIYDYPGEYEKRNEGDRLVKIRIEEEEAWHTVISGESDCRAFASGYKFDLFSHERRDQNASYVLTSVKHSAEEGGFYSGAGSTTDSSYKNSFRAIPAAVPFRPPRTTPKPFVPGTQTAVVVGPSGEEIYTDKYGRVKVQFHWDRRGQVNEKSSCWIRVAQPVAGKGWGALWLPRINQEVVVSFLEGDPDRPLITGSVYNAVQMPPYPLPDEQTKSTIKSYSSKGGGGFNEIRFEDKKGSEQLFVNAERNYDFRAKADRFETVGGESHLIVEKDQLELVKKDKHLHVKGDQNEKVDGTASLTTGQDLEVKVGQKHAVDAGNEIHLKAGMKVILEAGVQLTIKAGASFVDLGPAGVSISGTMVNINSGGSAGSGSGCSAQAPTDPKDADTAKPGDKSQPPPSGSTPPPPGARATVAYSPAALVLKQAAQTGAPFCDI